MDAQGLSSWYMSIQELPRCWKCAKKLFIASYVTFFGVKNKVREVYEAPLKRKLPSLLLVTSVTSCRTMFVLINHVGICLILNIGLRRNLYREFPASEFSGRVGLMLFWEDVPFESIWLMRFQVGWSHRLPLPPCHEHFFGWPLGDEHDLLQDPVHVETGWCARMGCENHGTQGSRPENHVCFEQVNLCK